MQKQIFDMSSIPWVRVQRRPPSLHEVVTCFLPLPAPWPGRSQSSKPGAVGFFPLPEQLSPGSSPVPSSGQQNSQRSTVKQHPRNWECISRQPCCSKGGLKDRAQATVLSLSVNWATGAKTGGSRQLRAGSCFRGVWINPPP